jgi:HEAT repeat protein
MAFIKQKPVTPSIDERAGDSAVPAPAASYDDLQRALNADSAEERRWAARDLLDFPGSSPLLVARLNIESSESVREIIFTTLVRLGDAPAVAGLVECLRSEDAMVRNEAIEAMKCLPDAVAPIMRDLLADPDSDVRIFAVNVLESLRHPEVESWLSQVIEKDPHVNVCGTAVDLLGEVGSRTVLEPLIRLKTRFAKEPYIQFAADLAIKRILEG